MIPLFQPPKQDVGRMIVELKDTLTGRWWGQGPKVDRFEKEFGEKFGFPYSVMTNSGTAALHIAYRLADVGQGDEVIVPVLTCTATCHPILLCGGKVVFADILPETLTVDPDSVRKKITKRTRAIVAVHLGGLVCNMLELRKICVKHGLLLIEDAAQALGSQAVGRGNFTCFSFQAIKHMSTGDGGMICVGTKAKARLAKRLRWFDIDREQKIKKGFQAWDRRGITFDQNVPAYKYQPTDIDASIGLVALETFAENYVYRKFLLDEYYRDLKDLPGVRLVYGWMSHAAWLAMIVVDFDRDDFAEFMKLKGIETNVAHVRNDVFKVFGGKRQRLPGMNSVEKKYLCLPLHDRLDAGQIAYITNAVWEYVKR